MMVFSFCSFFLFFLVMTASLSLGRFFVGLDVTVSGFASTRFSSLEEGLVSFKGEREGSLCNLLSGKIFCWIESVQKKFMIKKNFRRKNKSSFFFFTFNSFLNTLFVTGFLLFFFFFSLLLISEGVATFMYDLKISTRSNTDWWFSILTRISALVLALPDQLALPLKKL